MKTLNERYREAIRLLDEMLDIGSTNTCADDGTTCNGCGVFVGSYLPIEKHSKNCVVERAENFLEESKTFSPGLA